MRLTLKVKGDKELLDKFDLKKRQKYFGEATDKSLITIHKEASTYPPQRQGSSYRRTGTLGRTWDIKPFNGPIGQFGGQVVNDTEYGPWVMDPEMQAKVHKGVWRTTLKIVEDLKDKITGFYNDAIKKVMR